eukprot:TRINITY_DN5434_c3_g1_i1.p1 TRINITY_DN5434_c3_g1~~TRINITY_DN5434_c3_g1_i1.p1  ORF type:complete len:389 (-),score=110.02 TRINITY_DN5434_c3_g1_i1:2-1168(-)
MVPRILELDYLKDNERSLPSWRRVLLLTWREVLVVLRCSNRRFLPQIVGPLDRFLKPAEYRSEWTLINSYLRRMNIPQILKLTFLTFGSLACALVSCILMFVYSDYHSYIVVSSLAILALLWLGPLLSPGLPDSPVSASPSIAQQQDDDEAWMFVNGLCCDTNLTRCNALHLSETFNKRIFVFYNPTQGIIFDLIECMLGLVSSTRIGARLGKDLILQLRTKKKVVLCAHSQGSIIATEAVAWIIKESNIDKKEIYELLSKLTIFTFGCAAANFCVITSDDDDDDARKQQQQQQVPTYEHYANKDDFVAQIGVLSCTRYPGTVYSADVTGHMLGEHYLPYIKERRYKKTNEDENEKSSSLLYSYLASSSSPTSSSPSKRTQYVKRNSA